MKANKYVISSVLLLGVATYTVAFTRPEPPPEACQSKSNGSACTVNTPEGQLSGNCRKPPHESRYVCVPEGHGMRNKGKGFPSSPPSQQGTNIPMRRGGGGRPAREHTTKQSVGLKNLVVANQQPIAKSVSSQSISSGYRVLSSNGVSKHLTGAFPNQGNPNSISTQRHQYRVPAKPALASKTTELGLGKFGIAVNGIPFDPGAAEWYNGIRNSQWRYEALSGAVALGVDENYAHVQPTGSYHYHGIPSLLLSGLSVKRGKHSPLVGWAADGFPIYALYGYQNARDANSAVVEQTSSYKIKYGNRETGGNNPGGKHDGTFVADYKFLKGSGTLDECNGRFTKTVEFPSGTYAYFLTNAWPVIPRCFKGTPSSDFKQRPRD